MSEYVLFPDPGMLVSHHLTSQPQNLDLAASPTSNLVIGYDLLTGSILNGTIAGQETGWLPFAWLVGTGGKTHQPDLMSGYWTIPNVVSDESTWTASAPGFYSQEIKVTGNSMAESLSIELERRPDTALIPWGQGSVIIPLETRAQATDARVTFESGWLWGDNPGREPVVLETSEASITVNGGRFALQRLPGEMAWFHLFEGSAEVRSTRDDATLLLSPGEAVALVERGDMQPITYRDGLLPVIESDGQSPSLPFWKPTLAERIGSRMEEIGINSAQIITFITYIVTILSLVVLSLFLLKWLFKQRRKTGANK